MEDRAIAGERHLRGARRVDAHTSTGPGLGPGAESSAGRIKELDGIRGLAVVAIVVTHATPDWLHLGWAAVDLFFGLSGFLITSIVLKHGGTPKFLRRFYVRRGLRTWPIYYLTILGLIVFRRYLPVRLDWSGLWYYLTYTQNVPIYWSGVNPRFHGFLAHTWSLAIEEQFYLLWPALVLLCGPRRVPLLATTCIMVSVVARGFGWPTTLLLTRMDGLALGALLAAILHGEIIPKRWFSRIVAGIAALGVLGVIAAWLTVGIGLPDRTLFERTHYWRSTWSGWG